MRSSTERTIEKSELDYYLDEAPVDSRTCTKFDVLDYWKANSARFPCLSKIVCDIICILITTVVSESAFSIGFNHGGPMSHLSKLPIGLT